MTYIAVKTEGDGLDRPIAFHWALRWGLIALEARTGESHTMAVTRTLWRDAEPRSTSLICAQRHQRHLPKTPHYYSKNRIFRNRTVGKISKGWRIALGVFGALATLPTLYAIYSPQVGLTPTPPAGNSSLSAPFILKNEGQFSIHNIETTCAINHAQDVSEGFIMSGIMFDSLTDNFKEIGSGEEVNVRCRDPNGQINVADVIISITYRPSFTFGRRTKRSRFVTRPAADGKMQWMPYGLQQLP
jgi:hypothetical protein